LHCRELREFEASKKYPDEAELDLISSITSTRIEKITLNYYSTFGLFVRRAYWTRLDNILVKLGKQSECELGLLVKIRVALVSPGEELWSGLTEYLPRFVEKGRVIVSDSRERLIHSSDGVGEGK
jgi:hypothetical protein